VYTCQWPVFTSLSLIFPPFFSNGEKFYMNENVFLMDMKVGDSFFNENLDTGATEAAVLKIIRP